jgi:hypothetical protein
MTVPDRFVFRVKEWRLLTANQLAAEKCRALENTPVTHFIELNTTRSVQDQTPNDPLYGQMWALKQIKAPQAWDFQKGSGGITICVLDISVEMAHPDFQLPGGDSRLLPGYNVVTNGTDASPDPNWQFSHGTGVAGITCAATNNGLMVAGLCWEGVKVYPIRASDNPFFLSLDLLEEAYQRVKDYNTEPGHPKIAVLNLSFGGSYKSEFEGAMLHDIREQGTLIFAAAGNERPFGPPGWPANWPDVISVAATANGGGIASYSSQGDSNGHKVDIAAPGGDGFGADGDMTLLEMRGTTSLGVGTSYSCAMASGAAALLISSDFQPDQVFDVLRQTANPRGQSVPNQDYGYGEIDLFKAIQLAKTLPFEGKIRFEFLRSASPPTSCTLRLDYSKSGSRTVDVYLDVDGNFKTAVLPDLFTVSCKYTHWLRKSAIVDARDGAAESVELELPNGDGFGNNNAVDIRDLNLEFLWYGLTNPDADLNGDGATDLFDITIVFLNFGLVGDP